MKNYKATYWRSNPQLSSGGPEYHFELMRYERITAIGVYADGKLLKKAKNIDTIEKYCRRVGIPLSLVGRDASCDFEY